MEKKPAILIEAQRQGYNPDQIHRTMTVEELIGLLEDFMVEFCEDVEVFLSHDNGYTYGGIEFEDVQFANYDDRSTYRDIEDIEVM